MNIRLLETSDLHFQILNSQNQAVGEIYLMKGSEEVTIHFEILPKWQGQGYASKALGELTRYAHETLGLKYIHANITKDQDMARHVLEHHGYERIALEDNRLLYVHHMEETLSDDSYIPPKNQKVLYLAGGCFWGMEKAFRQLHGVTEVVTGYANGILLHPTYEQVCQNETGFREAVRITFDPSISPLQKVLQAYFICIHPEQADGQGEDIGTQYRTGIYFRDLSLQAPIQDFCHQEKKKYQAFYVEIKPLENFWLAEEYHQDYLSKIPNGYCHIASKEIQAIKQLNDL